MEVPHAFSLYKALSSGTFALLLGDPFRDAQTARLIELAEAVAERQGLSKGARARLAFVLVEAFQNIIRHRPPADGMQLRSSFLFGAVPSGQQVITCNPVADADLPALRSALHGVLGKDADTLKDLFLRGLQANAASAKGGAGLGLIEMARRSGRDLGHALEPLEAGVHRFMLQVLLGDAAPWSFDRVADACHAQEAHRVVAAMLGEPAPALLNALLGLVQETGLGGEPLHACLLAATQYIDDSADHRSGPVLLSVHRQGAGGWSVLVGSEVPPGEAERLEAIVGGVRGGSAFHLKRRYRAALQGGDPAGAGLLEMAMRATGGLTADRWALDADRTLVWVEARS
ncbi:MAG: hypothetical protein IPJ87_13530 [Flavobacteriales bacterium]|jgi:hypothetical protein|nr:hypothetical protein [Flavobacteriales bacterium]MBK7942872.1 hypothetical protein [Flavobacteriales bacterium]MBK9698727.1 hypothetical protein [Flavobacteriales bacterium]